MGNNKKIMVFTGFFVIFTSLLLQQQQILAYPQAIRIPEILVSPAQEVNSLGNRQHYPRSISRQETLNGNKIEETIKEVEAMIKANPNLPRLTRGEILDLLENITATDQEKLRNPKAIMVVMPFTPSNGDNRNIEELYTKAPVTHIIGAEPFKTNHQESSVSKPKSRRRPTSGGKVEKKSEVPSTTKSPEDKFTVPPKHRRRRPEVTTEKTTTTTYRVKSRRRSTTTPQPFNRHPNHRYPDDDTTSRHEFVADNGGLRIVKPPKFTPPVPPPQQINDHIADLSVEENIKQEVILRQKIPVAQKIGKTTTTQKPLVNEIITLPVQKIARITTTQKPLVSDFITPFVQKIVKTSTTTPKPLIDDINLPSNLKKVVQDLNLDTILSEEEIQAKYQKSKFVKTTPAPTTTTSSTIVPDVSSVADNLSPELRDLLMSFGLLANPNEQPSTEKQEKYIPDKAEVKPESYVGFKPLPEDGPSREGMDALLASFGLGRSARKQKAVRTKVPEDKQNFDVVPDEFIGVLSDLGLRQERKIRTQTNPMKTLEKQHVFNPDTQYASKEELKKLSKLIDAIKQLEKLNGTATAADLKKIDMNNLRELITSLNNSTENFVTLDEVNAPDPNKYDKGLRKNEFKRQQSTITTTTTTISPATTEELRSPSISDLEASFGGQTEIVTEAPVPETTTLRTGFYYLVDWNSFLDIDDQKGKRVNLRFQPTIGDPKRFLSVTVP